ncbi:MAG TPA: hypothetical protein VMS43_10745 [Allosphingosinicella sp.]|nr:hypothetical protein [Allosphingosinicella sp.]
MRTELAGIPPGPVEWGLPSLSLHESVADLLNHIFDYSASPMVGLDGRHCVTAGALMAGKSLADLEARLKIDLTIRPAPAFLLVRLSGSRGTSYYTPEWQGLNRKTKIMQWLTPEGRNAMARLRLREMRKEGAEFHGDITARQARRYLGYFHDMGTHIIRSISYGECLFQVFEANEDLLPGLKDCFAGEPGQNQVCGPMAFGMAHLTRPPWATSASPILSASESACAQQVAHHQIWTSGRPGEPCSLLSPGAMPIWSRTAVLNMLPAQSIVAVSFASQALYLEDHRADAWTRLMRAGLCQQFPALHLSGWRVREQFPLAGFLASATLAGEEALCKPAAPVLPDIAFVLDLTAPGRIMNPSADCLAFFAATNPGTGRAAEFEVDCPAFDPAELNIPFVDGALCVTDRKGERSCLVEGAWLGRTDDGRPGIKGAPAEPDATVLIRHAPQLTAYVRLMGLMQGSGVPPGAGAAMRRSAAWLAEATSRHPSLVQLRWQALQVARGTGQSEPGNIVLDPALESDLAQLLSSCMDLLALPGAGMELRGAAQHTDRRLRAFYGRLPYTLEAADLDRRSLAAGEALQRRFASFREASDLPEQAAALFAAGATLCLPPDLHRMPHGVVPGDDPYAIFWNALLGLRARYAECRAILLAMQCRTAEAIDLLEREIISGRDGPSDPARDVLTSLDAFRGALPHISATDRDILLTEMAELLELCRSAHLLQLASGGDPEGSAGTGPQLHRLLIVLEVLQLCRAADIPLAPLDSLAPTAFAARIDQALMATAQHRQSA